MNRKITLNPKTIPKQAMPEKTAANSSDKSDISMASAMVIQPVLPRKKEEMHLPFDPEGRLEEAKGLAEAISLTVIGEHIVKLSRVIPATLMGKGTCAAIAEEIADKEPDVVIINHSLTPIQQRNLEREWQSKVIDRTGLILEIFGERAQTREGQIQVDLASLEYQKSRLVRSWTHLERQRGGAGFMGGPGETQLEIDRRLITEKIAKLKKDLEHVRQNRELQRKSREKVPYPIIALVGYTNAGKSTLFNRLTGANVFAEDLLFATLDPTMRKVTLDTGQDAILSDTVGFIADLPTHLVAAFRSTLEQVSYADIVLHVRDISDPNSEVHKKDVIKTLQGLDINYEEDPRIIEIWNKIDLLDPEIRVDIESKADFSDQTVAVSAITGKGESRLLAMIEAKLAASRKRARFTIPVSDGRALAWLHENSNVLKATSEAVSQTLLVDIAPADLDRFTKRFKYSYQEDNDNKKQLYGQ